MINTINYNFNAQANSPGDNYGPGVTQSMVQLSVKIRSFNLTNIHGSKFDPGYLQDYDLNRLLSLSGSINTKIINIIRKELKDKDGTVYIFRHNEKKKFINHGIIIIGEAGNMAYKESWDDCQDSSDIISYMTRFVSKRSNHEILNDLKQS